MSNRPYLFSSESDDANDWKPYKNAWGGYDSRNNIPLSRFFFFGAGNARMVEIKSLNGRSSYQELRFITRKEEAVRRFSDRLPLLQGCIADPRANALLHELSETVKAWPVKHLIMDTEELTEGMPLDYKDHNENFDRIWSAINADRIDEANIQKAVEALAAYTGIDRENDQSLLKTLIGHRYL